MSTLKILQLNMWFGKLPHPILKLITQEQPDIIFLQEAVRLVRPVSTGGLYLTVDEIMQECEYSECFYAACFELNHFGGMWMGNCILSRHPLSAEQYEFLTDNSFERNFSFRGGSYNIRNVQICKVRVGSAEIALYNHHGFHVKDHKRGNDETVRHMKRIHQLMSGESAPVIFCGDLNLEPDSPSLELLNRDFVNHVVDGGYETTRTDLSPKTECCDYVFTSRDLDVGSFVVSSFVASDHAALLAEINI